MHHVSELGIQLISTMIQFHESCQSFEYFKRMHFHYRIVCFSHSVMLPSLFVVLPDVQRGFEEVLPLQSTQSFVSVFLSQYYGYYIHIIPELCSKFRVVDVGLIMALLR